MQNKVLHIYAQCVNCNKPVHYAYHGIYSMRDGHCDDDGRRYTTSTNNKYVMDFGTTRTKRRLLLFHCVKE
jgi:hypothetical protein